MSKKPEADPRTLEARVAKLERELELLHEMYHRLVEEFERVREEIPLQSGNRKPQ